MMNLFNDVSSRKIMEVHTLTCKCVKSRLIIKFMNVVMKKYNIQYNIDAFKLQLESYSVHV